MASNSSAEESRKAQDVDTPAHHQNDPKGTFHWGRGGEGNMMTVGSNGDKKKERTPSRGQEGKTQRTGSFKGAVDKGKEMLGLKNGKTDKSSESAIED